VRVRPWPQPRRTRSRMAFLDRVNSPHLSLRIGTSKEWTFFAPGRVEPVCQSPGTIAYGFFAHGTDPHDRPYSSSILSRANHLCRPPSPAHSAADRSVAWLSPRLWYYSAVRRLARRRSPLRLPAYRVTCPGATREPNESSWGHV